MVRPNATVKGRSNKTISKTSSEKVRLQKLWRRRNSFLVQRLPGIGKATSLRLKTGFNIRTIGDLAQFKCSPDHSKTSFVRKTLLLKHATNALVELTSLTLQGKRTKSTKNGVATDISSSTTIPDPRFQVIRGYVIRIDDSVLPRFNDRKLLKISIGSVKDAYQKALESVEILNHATNARGIIDRIMSFSLFRESFARKVNVYIDVNRLHYLMRNDMPIRDAHILDSWARFDRFNATEQYQHDVAYMPMYPTTMLPFQFGIPESHFLAKFHRNVTTAKTMRTVENVSSFDLMADPVTAQWPGSGTNIFFKTSDLSPYATDGFLSLTKPKSCFIPSKVSFKGGVICGEDSRDIIAQSIELVNVDLQSEETQRLNRNRFPKSGILANVSRML